MNKTTARLCTAAFLGSVSFATLPAFAQSQIETLEARIAALEADAITPRFSFATDSGTSIEIYGFVRFEAFYDFDFEQGDFTLPNALNTLTPTDGTFDTSVRVSRLGVRASQETDIGTIGGQVEFDLLGSGGSSELRLRHANVTVGGFLIGQYWTNFMPLDHYPSSADFNGPVGITFARVPQVRYTGTSGALTYSASVEQSAGNSDDPLITGALQYATDQFSARFAALAGTQQANGA